MTERVDEIITLIEELKRGNEINSHDFMERLNIIKNELDGIYDNKDELNAVVKSLMELVDSKIHIDSDKVNDIEELLEAIQVSVKEAGNNDTLAEQVKLLAENFKSGFNSVISFANKDAEAKNLLLDRLNDLEQAVKSGAMIETLRQRTDDLVNGYENFISDSNLRHGNMVSALVDLKNKIDDYSSKNNYTFGSIEHSVEDAGRRLSELESTVSSGMGNVNSKLYSLGDDIQKILNDGFDHLKYLSSNISESMNSNSIDTKAALECLRANIQDYAQNLNNEIKTLNTAISVKIEETVASNNVDKDENISLIKNLIDEYKYSIEKLAEEINSRAEKTSSELSELKLMASDTLPKQSSIDNLSNLINEKFSELSNITNKAISEQPKIENLSDLINEKFSELSNITNNALSEQPKIENLSDLIDEKFYQLNNITDKALSVQPGIENLSDLINEKFSDCSLSVRDGLSGIKLYLDELMNEIKSNIPDYDDVSIKQKLTELNTQFGDAFTGYEQALAVLSNRLEEYIQTAEQVSEDAKLQQDTARNAVSLINEKFEGLANQLSGLVGNSGLIEILADIRKQFSSVISSGQANKEAIIGDFKETIESSLSDFSSRILNLAESISSLESSLGSDNTSEEIEKTLSEIKLDLGQQVSMLQLSVRSSIDELKADFEPLRDSVKVFVGLDIAESLSSVKEQVELSYVQLLSELGNKIENISSFDKVENSYKEVVAKIGDMEGVVNDSVRSCVETLEHEFAIIRDYVENNLNSSESLQELFRSEIDRLEEKINSCSSGTRNSITEQLETIKTAIEQHKGVDTNTVIDAIIPLLDDSDILDIMRGLNKNLADRIDELKNHDEKALQDITEIVTSISSTVEHTLSVINEKFEKPNTLDENILNDIKSISDKLDNVSNLLNKDAASEQISKVNSSINEIKTALQQVSLSTNILENYEQTLKILDGKLDIIAMSDDSEEMNVNFQQIKEAVDNIHKTFSSDSPMYSMMQTINGKLDVIAQNDDSAFYEHIDDIKADINDLSTKISESESRLDKFVKTLDGKMDVFALAASDDNQKVSDLLSEGLGKLNNEISQTVNLKIDEFCKQNGQISEKFEDVNSKVSEVLKQTEQNSQDLSGKFESVHNKLDNIDGKVDDSLKVEALVKELNSKVDIIAMSDDTELFDEIYEIRTLVENQINDSTYKSEVEASLHKIIDEIDKLDSNVSGIDYSKRTEEIKDAIIAAIVSVTGEISFVEEAEELKDFVSERTSDIHRTLMDVKHQLSAITNSSGDMDLYTYTLQDVESDLAKLRMSVNEIANRAPQNELSVISNNMNKMSRVMDDLRQAVVGTENIYNDVDGNLNEQILSISTRLNKLLLTQEETDEKILNQLENNFSIMNNMDNVDSRKRMETVLHSVDQRLETSLYTINVLKNVMMYLGEWMDGTTETLTKIYDKYQDVVTEIKDSMPDNTVLAGALEDRLSKQESKIKELQDIVDSKISQQDLRLDRMEKQLDRICEFFETEFREHSENARLDNIENKLKDLNTNIEKLASYVD